MAAIVGLGSGCGRNNISKEIVELESYGYDATLVMTDTSGSGALEPGRRYMRCYGRGVLPLVFRGHDVGFLRDSLCRLAGVEYGGKGEVTPVAGDGWSLPETAVAENIQPESEAYTDLSVTLVTPQIVVWKCMKSGYLAGAAHGMYATSYVNYSVVANKILSLSDLMRSGYQEPLRRLLAGKLADRDDLFDNDGVFDIPSVFEITDEGLTLVYGLYQIAPYSSGEIRVDFEVYELADILTPAAMTMITGISAQY